MPDEYRAVVGGVDTHRDTHTAAAVDSTGRLLGTATFLATRAGYEQLWGWLRGLGSVESANTHRILFHRGFLRFGVDQPRFWRVPPISARTHSPFESEEPLKQPSSSAESL